MTYHVITGKLTILDRNGIKNLSVFCGRAFSLKYISDVAEQKRYIILTTSVLFTLFYCGKREELIK